MLQGDSAYTACPPLLFRPTLGPSLCKAMFQLHPPYAYLCGSNWLTLIPACILQPRRPWWRCHMACRPYRVIFPNLPAFISLTLSLFFSQGVPVELLCRPTSAGVDLDVCSARHDRQALHPLSDPLRCLWLTAGFCHCDGALRPTERGRGGYSSPLVFLLMIAVYWDMQCLFLFEICKEV